MIIKIPFKTPCGNHYIAHNGKFTYMYAEARKLKEEINDIVKTKLVYEDINSLKDKPLSVTINIHEQWYCKNGNLKRTDLDNKFKFIIDSVFTPLGIDDKHICHIEGNKDLDFKDGDEEYTSVEIVLL